MSSWDDKADDHAMAHHTYEHMSPEVNAKIYMGFVLGARWQREQIRECFDNHPDPRCEEHPDGDPISCGWKNAYAGIRDYMEGPRP